MNASNPSTNPSYTPDSSAFDELGFGNVPTHWQRILDYVEHNAGRDALREEMLVHDRAIERPWALDPLPMVFSDADWQLFETGLTQRADLLNRILADLYGRRDLLSAGGLPPALVFGNPRYLLPMVGYHAQDNEFLSLVAFDLGRSPDGTWRVLADWTEAPQGLGMCLENRVLVSRALPDLFQSNDTQRVSDFYNAFAWRLHNLAERATSDGIPVLLSRGPSDPSYFEHVYLGQYLGLPVVEGADLTVRGQSLELKTLEGLKSVGSVWRQVDSTKCDPLYLDTDTLDGVAGLANILKEKQAHAGNALGSGVLENDAFMSFLPGLAERFLGESLLIPNLPTWWCGQASVRDYVINNSSQLDITSAFDRNHEANPEAGDRSELLDYRHVARESIALSNVPYLDDDGSLAAGSVSVRLFVGRFQEGYRLLPSGIARVSTPTGELSKDVWVRRDVHTPVTFSGTAHAPSRSIRSDRDLPSRTADDLFWLGRYLERCACAARAYRTLLTRAEENIGTERQQTFSTILDVLAQLDMISAEDAQAMRRPTTDDQTRNWGDVLLDLEASDSLFVLQKRIYDLASQVRERLSTDTWRLFTALNETPTRWRLKNTADALNYLNRQMERLAALSGQIQENMTRSYGWRLLELGRRLERGQFVVRVMGELVSSSDADKHLHLILDLCDNLITYRARYQNIPNLENALELLLLDEINPRSVIYQISQLRDVMEAMPLDQTGDSMSESQRILLVAYHELTLAEPEKLANVISKAGNRTQLRRVLSRMDGTLKRLSELVTETYFAHTANSGSAR